MVGNRLTKLQVVPTEIEMPIGSQRQADGGQSGPDSRGHARPVIELADEHQGRLGVFQYLGHRVGAEVGIQRHRNVSGHPDGQVADDPMRGVLADDRNVAAWGQLPLP